MNQQNPVPRLDLAPKLKRPLSLWNPLDYLRLLYWVFYFPQALRWYVDTFGGGYIPVEEMNWRKGWERLRQNPIQRQLLLQGLVLTVAVPLVVCGILQGIGFRIDWSRVVRGVTGGVTLIMVQGVRVFIALGVVSSVEFLIMLGVMLGVIIGILGAGLDTRVSVPLGMPFVVALGVLLGVGIFRPETWVIASLLNLLSRQQRWLLSHVTFLPLPYLAPRLQKWLQQDWETSLHNINQLLAYTQQFTTVVKAVNNVLAKTPNDQIIWRVSRLAEAPFDWQIVRFASASLNKGLQVKAVQSLFFFFPNSWKQQLLYRFRISINLKIDTPAHATAAGFCFLYLNAPTEAMQAFAEVRPLLYGEEMFILAQTLAAFHDTKELSTIAALQLPAFPTEPHLRPITWKALNSLRRVIEDTQIIQHSVSNFTRSLTLNRALGELRSIIDNAETLPQAERELILDIAQTWQTALLKIAGEVGEVSITKPVTNPYIIGDPVEGNLFVGREDIMRQLEELWVKDHHLQSVVIYGHRRMGKTSILLNAARCLGEGVKVAYVNLLNVGDSPQGVGEVLITICDAISEAVNLPAPNDHDLLNLPYPTFTRYLKQVAANLNGGLIIALDEFEKIEDLIETGKIPRDFMGFLRGQVQMSSKIAFAFAGLHTLDEMTADYFHPFFGSIIPIRVGFMEPGFTRQILANPDQEFLLDYIPEALDLIHDLTAGQPFLVQLVGFRLVRGYNDYVFQQGRSRNPVFTIEDVEAVVNNPDFFSSGSGYFYGVWGQAARGSEGQQMILRALAPHREGLSLEELMMQLQEVGATTGGLPLRWETLNAALETLKRHDVIAEKDGRWRIIVELFRRWVVQRLGN
ncbi:MAG: ATP-binding protein [Coleofasciculaceae cyanobacterium]